MSAKLHSLLLALASLASVQQATAQGTAFTYQGQLSASGSPANGTYNLTFSLFNTNVGGISIAGPVTNAAVGITNGLFTVLVNFDSGAFTGATNWLELGVATNGVGTFILLSPRQQLTPTPYAIYAQSGNAAGLSGTVPLAQLPGAVVTTNEGSVTLSNVTVSGILSLPAAAAIDAGGGSLLSADGANNFYAGPGAGTAANSGSANTAIGSAALQYNTNGTNNTAIGYLALGNNTNGAYNTAIGERALNLNTSGNDNTASGRHALEANTVGSDNTANGYAALSANTSGSNNIALGVDAGFNITSGSLNIDIGNAALATDTNIIRLGSGQTSTFIAGVINGNGGGLTNLNASQLTSGTIPNRLLSGFQGNDNTVGGGLDNSISSASGASYATIGGGYNNLISSNSGSSTIGGGIDNDINTNSFGSTIAGGGDNAVNPNSSYSTIAGGQFNIISANSPYSTIAGGQFNIISANSVYYSTIAGGEGNIISANSFGSTIAGGAGNAVSGDSATVGGGYDNTNDSDGGTIAGGQNNTVDNSDQPTVGGGYGNLIDANSGYSTVAGGQYNIISANSGYAIISGGYNNRISANSGNSTIAGGYGNYIKAVGAFIGGGGSDGTNALPNYAYGPVSVIGGGIDNDASGYAATVPGGDFNSAYGAYSFAAGQNATANNQGSFVWADSQAGGFGDTAANQFVIRAQGGVGINTGSPQQALSIVGGLDIDQSDLNDGTVANALTFGSNSSEGIGSQRISGANQYDLVFYTDGNAEMTILHDGYVGIGTTSPGHLLVVGGSGSPAYCNGTTWVNGSDRNSKEAFAAINPRTVLEKVSALPITEWQYKVEANGTRHLGPVAQDFHAAFGLNGADDKHIATVDEEGVALAAIQGLNEKLNEKDAEIQALKQSVAELKQLVQSVAAQK